MNGHSLECGGGTADAARDLGSKIRREVEFFQGAANRALSWQKVWRECSGDEREDLILEQGQLLDAVMGRDRSLEEIHRLWRQHEARMREEERGRIEAAVRELDDAMQKLLRIEKDNLAITDQVRQKLVQEIGEFRAVQEAHAAYRIPGRSSPQCVDRDL